MYAHSLTLHRRLHRQVLTYVHHKGWGQSMCSVWFSVLSMPNKARLPTHVSTHTRTHIHTQRRTFTCTHTLARARKLLFSNTCAPFFLKPTHARTGPPGQLLSAPPAESRLPPWDVRNVLADERRKVLAGVILAFSRCALYHKAIIKLMQ